MTLSCLEGSVRFPFPCTPASFLVCLIGFWIFLGSFGRLL